MMHDTVLHHFSLYSFILLHGVVLHHDAWCSLSVFYEAKPPSPLSTHNDCTLPHLQTVPINTAFNLCIFYPIFDMGIDFIRNFGLNISFLLQQHNFPPKRESCLLTLEFLDVPWNWARPLISWRQTLLEIRVVLRREVLEMTLRSKKSAKIQFPTLTLIKLPISLSPPLFLEHCKVNWTDFTSSFENQCKDNVKNIFWVSISSDQKVRIVELVHIFEK